MCVVRLALHGLQHVHAHLTDLGIHVSIHVGIDASINCSQYERPGTQQRGTRSTYTRNTECVVIVVAVQGGTRRKGEYMYLPLDDAWNFAGLELGFGFRDPKLGKLRPTNPGFGKRCTVAHARTAHAKVARFACTLLASARTFGGSVRLGGGIPGVNKTFRGRGVVLFDLDLAPACWRRRMRSGRLGGNPGQFWRQRWAAWARARAARAQVAHTACALLASARPFGGARGLGHCMRNVGSVTGRPRLPCRSGHRLGSGGQPRGDGHFLGETHACAARALLACAAYTSVAGARLE